MTNKALIEGRRPVTAWVAAEHRAQLERLAEEHDRSVSAEVRAAIRAHVRDRAAGDSAVAR